MKKISILICAILFSCNAIPYKRAFPEFYIDQEKFAIKFDTSNQIIISNLPVEFQLAQHSGHLWTFIDGAGSVKLFSLNKNIQRNTKGKEFSQLFKKVKRDDNFIVFTPLAYPNVFCVMPNENIDNLYNESYFFSWLNYLDQWQTNEEFNEVKQKEYNDILISNFENKQLLSLLEFQIKEFLSNIKSKEELIEKIKEQIQLKKGNLNQKNASAKNKTINISNDPPHPFILKRKYEISIDPFIEILIRYNENLENELWASDQMEGGKYLDPELAEKIREINKILKNPTLVKNEDLKSKIISLKEKGFIQIVVTSGGRTPLRQADLYSKKKFNSNPVAKYLNSDHLFGQAADMSLPSSFENWESKNHQFLRSILSELGLIMNKKNDPVHFKLKNPNESYYVRRLAMSRAYSNKAKEIKQTQDIIRDQLIFDIKNIFTSKEILEKDIKNKNIELESKKTIFNSLSATYLILSKELTNLNAEEERKKAEEERRSRHEHDNDRDRGRDRGGFERPGVSAPDRERVGGSDGVTDKGERIDGGRMDHYDREGNYLGSDRLRDLGTRDYYDRK